ncbi:MAG: LamG domain-containing protein [Lachnospiraceae bacterium]|nr:LamG domain-containing protein [Lachnospiraceae bacterium]
MKKKLLVLAMAATMAVAGAMTAFADAPDDYEAYFSFDETIDDATGNYSLEVVGKAFADAVTTTDDVVYTDGLVNKALSVNSDGNLDGYNTGVDLAGTSYTISFVAQADTYVFATPVVWIGRADQSTENWHGFWGGFGTSAWSDGVAGVSSNESGDPRVGIAPETMLNSASTGFTWTVITWTFDADTQTTTLYYDGVNVGSVEGMPVLEDEADVYIGANYWDSPCVFYIDELYIYTRVLTEDEIATVVSASGVMSDEEKESLAAYVEESESISESERVSELASVQASRNAATADSSDDSSSDTSSDSDSNTTTIVVVVVVIVVVVIVVVAVVLGSKKKKK